MSHSKTIDDGGPEAIEWIKNCTAKISNAIGGGSELFVRHGDGFRLDVDFVCKRISEMRERQHVAMHGAIRAERALSDVKAKMEPLVGLLTGLVAESGRDVGYGEEDTFRMGEWFEAHDLAAIEAARAALSTTEGV